MERVQRRATGKYLTNRFHFAVRLYSDTDPRQNEEEFTKVHNELICSKHFPLFKTSVVLKKRCPRTINTPRVSTRENFSSGVRQTHVDRSFHEER